VNASRHRLLRLVPRDGEGCFALDYVPGELDDPRRRLVKELKAGSDATAEAAAVLLAAALADLVTAGPITLVAIPGHRAAHSAITEGLCVRVARLLPSARHRARLVRRVHDVPQSAIAVVRPSIDEHLASLEVTAPVAGSVIMVDDVFTHGRVSAACSQLLQDAGAGRIFIACVARTRL
jgi:predicted amidophosphoribosyltransferase